MKIQVLKQEVRQAWEFSHCVHGAVVVPKTFKAEIRSFGDLRRKSTWEKAYCHFYARNTHDSGLDAYPVILALAIAQNNWRYPYREAIFDEFMKLPDSLELIRAGLEELYLEPDFCTAQQREQGHEFFGLVQEQQGQTGGAPRLPVELIRRFAGTRATSAS